MPSREDVGTTLSLAYLMSEGAPTPADAAEMALRVKAMADMLERAMRFIDTVPGYVGLAYDLIAERDVLLAEWRGEVDDGE